MPALPQVVQLSLMHAKALDLMLYDNMMLMSGRWTTIRNRLQDKADEVAKEIYALQQSGKEVTQAWLNEHAYYRALAEQADNAAGQYAGWSANYTQQQIIKAAKFSTDEATLIAGRLYDTTAMGYFKGLPQAQVESIQAITLRDAPLDRLFRDISPNHYDELTNSLMTGLSMGMPMTEIAGLMMNVVDITYKRALLISRTEVNRAHRSATLRTYQQYEIPYYRRIASRGHACFACMMLDGMLYTSKEALDDHPNGACQMVPVLDPDSKSTDWEHGRERFLKMDEAEQRKIIGNNYFDAWKRNDFNINQMVVIRPNPIWGGSPGIRPLKELSPNWRSYLKKQTPTVQRIPAKPKALTKSIFDVAPFTAEERQRLIDKIEDIGWSQNRFVKAEYLENNMKSLDTLTREEKVAIAKYTGSEYRDLNFTLRNMAENPGLQLSHGDKELDELLSRAFLKVAPIDKEITVFRGSGNWQPKDAVVGSRIVDPAYMSTSIKSGFAGNSYTILVPEGSRNLAYIKNISTFEFEDEVLFNKNSVMEVLKIVPQDNPAYNNYTLIYLGNLGD